jgi:hypothetical protein
MVMQNVPRQLKARGKMRNEEEQEGARKIGLLQVVFLNFYGAQESIQPAYVARQAGTTTGHNPSLSRFIAPS